MNGLAYWGVIGSLQGAAGHHRLWGNGATSYCLMFYGEDNVPTNFSKRSAIICGSRAHLLWPSRFGYSSIVTSALGKPAGREMLSCFARAILVGVETRE